MLTKIAICIDDSVPSQQKRGSPAATTTSLICARACQDLPTLQHDRQGLPRWFVWKLLLSVFPRASDLDVLPPGVAVFPSNNQMKHRVFSTLSSRHVTDSRMWNTPLHPEIPKCCFLIRSTFSVLRRTFTPLKKVRVPLFFQSPALADPVELRSLLTRVSQHRNYVTATPQHNAKDIQGCCNLLQASRGREGGHFRRKNSKEHCLLEIHQERKTSSGDSTEHHVPRRGATPEN